MFLPVGKGVAKVISHTEDKVTVQYFDDDDPLTYNISSFCASADPAPCDIVDLTDKVQSSLTHEQSLFVMKERGELLPLQKKTVSDPRKWVKNRRTFDSTWGGTIDLTTNEHVVPQCKLKTCKLDCKKLNNDAIAYARSNFESFAKRGINDKIVWLNSFVRPVATKMSDGKIWSNYVREHVREGRQSWACSYCKCNPNSPAEHTIDDVLSRGKNAVTPNTQSAPNL